MHVPVTGLPPNCSCGAFARATNQFSHNQGQLDIGLPQWPAQPIGCRAQCGTCFKGPPIEGFAPRAPPKLATRAGSSPHWQALGAWAGPCGQLGARPMGARGGPLGPMGDRETEKIAKKQKRKVGTTCGLSSFSDYLCNGDYFHRTQNPE